jgi:hypothetical protein
MARRVAEPTSCGKSGSRPRWANDPAKLASEGLSNREIADTLFVTVRTVEFHLSSTFRKLGVRSRQELSDELSGKID